MPRTVPKETRQRIIAEYEAERLERGIAWGECFCGCGEPSGFYKYTVAHRSVIKGQPKRFVNGHNPRKHGPLQMPAARKQCECGCGEPTSLITENDASEGAVRGEFRRFVAGHAARRPGLPYKVQDLGYTSPCWVWQRYLNVCGYGALSFKQKKYIAPRFYYEQAYGPIPEGKQLDHLCVSRTKGRGGSRACVNPEHLEPVTSTENGRRKSNSNISCADVPFIRSLLNNTNLTQKEIAAIYEVSEYVIGDINRGRTWKNC